MHEKRSLGYLTTSDLIRELVRRGWELSWVTGSNPLQGNLELEGPEQVLPANTMEDGALGMLEHEILLDSTEPRDPM